MVALYSEIIILGGVPMVVFIPPKMHANAKGIRNLDGCQSIFWHTLRVMGNKIAKAPILFIKEERNAAINNNEIKNWSSVNFLVPIIFPTKPVKPEFFKPWLITRTRATVRTAGWENPKKASEAGITPKVMSSMSAAIVRASYLNFPHIKAKRSPARVKERINWSLIIILS